MSNIPYLNRALEDYLKQIKTSSKRVPFIATTFFAIQQTCKKNSELKGLSGFLDEASKRFPVTTELQSVYDEVDPEFVISNIYPIVSNESQMMLRDAYLSLFRLKNDNDGSPLAEDQANLLLAVIADHDAIFVSKKTEIARAVEDLFCELPYLENFTEDYLQNNYVTRYALSKFIGNIKNPDLASGDFKQKLNLLIKMNVSTLGEQVLTVLAELSEYATQTSVEPNVISQLNRRINKLLIKIKEEVFSLEEKTQLSRITKNIASWYDVGKDFVERSEFVPNILLLSQAPDYPDRSILDERLRNFSRHATIEALDKLNEQSVEYLVRLVPHEFRANVVDNMSIYTEIMKYLSDDQKVSLVSNFLDKASIVSTPDQKDIYFEKIAELKGAGDVSLIQSFHDQLVSVNSPDLARKYGRRQFFNTAQKQELATVANPQEKS